MADSSVDITAGSGTPIDTWTVGTNHRQIVMLGDKGGYRGRASTFRIAGIAGTTGQRLFSIHNASGSTIKVDVHKVAIDVIQTAVMAITVVPPVIRLYRVTVLPTGGTAVTKVAEDTSRPATSSSVTLLQGTASDGGAATNITATLPANNVITQEYVPRMITAVGYEMADRMEFLAQDNEAITLGALEGLVVNLDYTTATQNPTSNHYIVTVRWEEYTP